MANKQKNHQQNTCIKGKVFSQQNHPFIYKKVIKSIDIDSSCVVLGLRGEGKILIFIYKKKGATIHKKQKTVIICICKRNGLMHDKTTLPYMQKWYETIKKIAM